MKKVVTGIFFLIVFNQVAAQDFSGWQTAFERSYAYEANKDYAQALDAIQDIYEPESYDLNIRFGWLHYSLGDFPNSKKYYAQSMEILPYSLEAKFGYVLPLSSLGEWDEVISIYKSMLEIDPKNTTANYRLGAIYYARTNYQLAYNHLEEVINLYPNDYDSNVLFAWTNLQMGKLKEAKVLFNKSLLIKPESDSAKEGLNLIK
jgi:tetratricopeptide (TPR) repeat protein